ncbi:MAG TPA: 23S rRNA (uracil(1939)-C(5))-methyltransferase RlmD [Chitinophagales bacterium]|nr:23S rRNA (uracil(1939)-C(5))-methyltransferase RlmD [Chitinophagales bacterium]
MMNREKLIEKLEIIDVEFHGRGVARHNGKVMFVENALPGEVVDASVFQKKKGYAFARPVTFHKTSPNRILPFCSHFGTCGGCTWQNVTYEKQLDFKRKFIEEAFVRIGKLDFPEIPPVIGCTETKFYRNKLEFTFSNRKWLTEKPDSALVQETGNTPALGFHKPGLFDKVVDIETCYLQPEPSNKIRLALKEFAIREKIPFFDIRTQQGVLRTLIIRTSLLHEVLVIVTFFKEDEAVKKVMEFLKTHFPEITSLNFIINPRSNDAVTDQPVITYDGAPFIRERLGELTFHIGPKSFFQVNVAQAKKLFDKAMEFAVLQGSETVYDLYCGIGSISLSVARHCKKVIGVEQSEDAVRDARNNAQLNNIVNCEFYSGDASKMVNEEFINAHGKPDVIFLDPPRSGIHPKLIQSVLQIAPEKIVYVSCHPATQARDISLLRKMYYIDKVQPVDMFPQTYHIENVVLLTRCVKTC